MQTYEDVGQLYEDLNQIYERAAKDCFDGLHNLFAATYQGKDAEDLREVFAVIAYELCKAKAEIERMRYLRDPDRVPIEFIQPLTELYGIKNFPANLYPEDQRRFMSFAYEIQKYKGTKYGLELLLKSFLPFDNIELTPMYKRGLRRFYPNNDYTGGRILGSTDSEYNTKLSAGYPIDWRIQGASTYPTGIYICITVTNRRNRKVIQAVLNKIEPIMKTFLPETGFYKVVFVNTTLDEYAVTDGTEQLYFGEETVSFGEFGVIAAPPPTNAQYIRIEDSNGDEQDLLLNDDEVYYVMETP